MFLRLPQEYYCSQVYGRPSQDYFWQSLRFGAPSRIPRIRGAISCWEPSVPPWPCSDRAPGRSMPACLDGSASIPQTERVRSLTSFVLVLTHFKRVFLPVLFGAHGDSIWGCPPDGTGST